MLNKRTAWKFISAKSEDAIRIDDIAKHVPPPSSDKNEPAWSIYFHARGDKDGKPFLSGSQVCDPKEMATAICLWVMTVCRAQKSSASDFLERLAKATKKAERMGAFKKIKE